MTDELFDNNKKINDLMLSKYPKNKDSDVSSIVRKAQKLEEIAEQYEASRVVSLGSEAPGCEPGRAGCKSLTTLSLTRITSQ